MYVFVVVGVLCWLVMIGGFEFVRSVNPNVLKCCQCGTIKMLLEETTK
jgi:hypothetical protein